MQFMYLKTLMILSIPKRFYLFKRVFLQLRREFLQPAEKFRCEANRNHALESFNQFTRVAVQDFPFFYFCNRAL